MNGFFELSLLFIGMAIGNSTPTNSIWAFIVYIGTATIFYIFGIIEDTRRIKNESNNLSKNKYN